MWKELEVDFYEIMKWITALNASINRDNEICESGKLDMCKE